jgi:hypothetical protein
VEVDKSSAANLTCSALFSAKSQLVQANSDRSTSPTTLGRNSARDDGSNGEFHHETLDGPLDPARAVQHHRG